MVSQIEQKQLLADVLVTPQQIALSDHSHPVQQMVQVIAYFFDDTDGVLVQIQAEHDPDIYTILLSPSTPQATFFYMPISFLACRYRYRREEASGVFGEWSPYRAADHPLVLRVRR